MLKSVPQVKALSSLVNVDKVKIMPWEIHFVNVDKVLSTFHFVKQYFVKIDKVTIIIKEVGINLPTSNTKADSEEVGLQEQPCDESPELYSYGHKFCVVMVVSDSFRIILWSKICIGGACPQTLSMLT